MEVIIKVKNISRVFNHKQGDVIVCDGKDWYITTKEDILKDAYNLIEECKAELDKTKAENAEFKKTCAKQIKDLSDAIQILLKDREEN